MGFQNILVPYNGTTGAKDGLEAAIDLATKTKGKITLITCIEHQSILSFLKIQNIDKMIEKEIKSFEKEYSLLQKRIEKLNVPFKYVILKSSFSPDTIASYAKSNNIDTLVIGKTKFKGSKNLYHESMINYLSSRIDCPMVVVK